MCSQRRSQAVSTGRCDKAKYLSAWPACWEKRTSGSGSGAGAVLHRGLGRRCESLLLQTKTMPTPAPEEHISRPYLRQQVTPLSWPMALQLTARVESLTGTLLPQTRPRAFIVATSGGGLGRDDQETNGRPFTGHACTLFVRSSEKDKRPKNRNFLFPSHIPIHPARHANSYLPRGGGVCWQYYLLSRHSKKRHCNKTTQVYPQKTTNIKLRPSIFCLKQLQRKIRKGEPMIQRCRV